VEEIMTIQRIAAVVAGFYLMIASFPVPALDLMPKARSVDQPATSGLTSAYWLMSEGGQVGYKIKVEINGQPVTTIKKPGEALEVTNYLHLGLNTIRFQASDAQRSSTGASASQLTITLGPEHRREATGNLGGYSIELREHTIRYTRPAGHRGGDHVVEMRFTVKDNPNPGGLSRRYILYSDGKLTGHLIQVAVDGIPILDIQSPDFHCDLNPYLKKGANEITFSAASLEGFPFTASERQSFGDGGLEVGTAAAGDFNAATYNEPVREIMKLNQRFVQPGENDQPEGKETVTLIAE
jgi:hypothetical protein